MSYINTIIDFKKFITMPENYFFAIIVLLALIKCGWK